MNNVSFAGYDPKTYRTIAKKYQDFGTIDAKINQLNKDIANLTNAIKAIESKITSKIQAMQNVNGMDTKALKAEIKALNAEKEQMEAAITEKKGLMSSLWYGYHERL